MRLRVLFFTAVVTMLTVSVGWRGAPEAAPVPVQSGDPDPRFGAVGAIWDPAAAAEARVGWERILLYWSELQPEGLDDWNYFHVPEEWLTQAEDAGREVVGLLKHTPAWATDGTPGCGPPRGLDLPLDDPDNLWAEFVRMAVERYVGRISHWIIWNEPDIAVGTHGLEWCGTLEEYYQLLKVAYLAAHEVNPDVTIQMAGMSYYHDPEYLGKLLDVAVADSSAAENGYYFDIVPVHIYFQSEAVPLVISDIRATLDSYGLEDKAIWLNETNSSPDSDPLWPLVRPCWPVSLEEQASFLLQSFSLALASGAERVAVYQWIDWGLPPGGEPFGVIRPDHSRRPAFDAYKLITTHYADTVSASAFEDPLLFVVTLQRGERTTRVIWARTDVALIAALPALADTASLISQTGDSSTASPSDGYYEVTVPASRCQEEYEGCPVEHPLCMVGGPTLLLIEEASGEPDAPWVLEEGVLLTPTPPLAPSPTPSPTATVTPTRRPTTTPTESPTETAGPTVTPTPEPEAGASRSTGSWALIALTTIAAFLLAALTIRQMVGPSEEADDEEDEE